MFCQLNPLLLDSIWNKMNVQIIRNAIYIWPSIVLPQSDHLFLHSCESDNLFISPICSRLIIVPAPVTLRHQSSATRTYKHETQLPKSISDIVSSLNNQIERH